MPNEIAQFKDARAGRPLWMRTLNAAGRLIPWAARPSAPAWWAEARERAGADLPEPGSEAIAALGALTHSLVEDSALNLIGRIAAKDDTIRMARNHLRIAALLRDRPEILETPLPDPVFIIGLPRTGTTFLHQLMAADPTSRTIPYWESFDPIPPKAGPDRRAASVDRMLKQLESLATDYHAIHPMTAEGAEECVALFMNELRTMQFDIQYKAPSYANWLLAEDARIAYRAYLRQLRIIQFFRPTGNRFVLKDPTHLLHLEALVEIFPNAKLIFTHRDPAESISSICSLYAHTRAIFSDEVDPIALGHEILAGYWPDGLERALLVRDRLPPTRYVDVQQADLARDPLASLRPIYEKWGWTWSPETEKGLEAFLRVDAKSHAGRHEHRPEGFGLRAEGIREHFKRYVEAFDL